MSLEETDARLRRQYIIFIAVKLAERDKLVDQFVSQLRQITGAELDAKQLELLRKITEIDGLLMQSRFSRALSNATWFDHAIGDVVGFAKARPRKFFMSVLYFCAVGVFTYLVATGKLFPGLMRAVDLVVGIPSAGAASIDFSNPDHIKIVIVLGIAFVLCFSFVFFPGAACLASNGETRRRSWEFVKHTSTFMLGIIAGYFGRAL